MPVPLLISLPPKLARQDARGRDIGDGYQRRCAESWREAGFLPISVNSREELRTAPALLELAQDLGVRVVSVEKDAADITGRPHVFLSDLLDAARAASDEGPFAITNADILFGPASSLSASTDQLRPGVFLLARRIDISDPEQRTGASYSDGFDFFAVHSRDIANLSNIGLILGAPWWDHYFPLMLAARGCRRILLQEPAIFHLDHSERWDWKVWQSLGQRFMNAMATMLKSPECSANASAHEYELILERAMRQNGRVWLPDFLSRRPKPEDVLHRVSSANISFLGQAEK